MSEGIGDADLTLVVSAVGHFANQGVVHVKSDVGAIILRR